MKLLLLLLLFQVPPAANLPNENKRQIERVEDRVYSMERQFDRIERTVDEVKGIVDSPSSTDILLYVLMALLGIDKGSYWIRRRNGRINGNSKGGKGS